MATPNEKVSFYFTLPEVLTSDYAARNGINNILPFTLRPVVENTGMQMDKVRNLLGKPIHVNSWYRNAELNKAIGGASTSQHCRGEAVDFICPQYGSPLEICQAIIKSEINFDQLILEHTWVHISFAYPPGKQQRKEVLSLLENKRYAKGLTNLKGIPYER